MAEGGKQDCEIQKNEIGPLVKTSLKKDEEWFLIDTKWFKQWKKYVGYDSWDTGDVGEPSAHPGPIDNSPILEGNSELKPTLIDELDYQLVPEEAWNKLVTIFGIVEPQQPICRKVIEQGMFVKHCKVEVYLMDLKLCTNNQLENTVSHRFSRADVIGDIETAMRTAFNIKEDKEVRLWNKYMSNTFEPLSKKDNSILDSGLYEGQVIVIEEMNDDGTWPRQLKASTSSSQQSTSKSSETKSSFSTRASSSIGNSYSKSSYENYKSRNSTKPGLCGLSNLGNTCFMNSALQCMSNVPALTNYFLAGKWKEELNMANPLGMHGEIAKSYAELVGDIWSGNHSYTIPRSFKIAVGRFAEQFSGYQQQDSQELMAFLLDGLHEDLNRIKKKPYVEIKDANGRPDYEVAKEAWDGYLKRNDSIIVDLFHGLLKSTLVCPECKKVSIQFDPFCYLSLPLPLKKERHLEIFFIPLDPLRKAVHYKLTAPKLGQVHDLCKALAEKTAISPDDLLVTDVYNHKFHKVFGSDESLSHIMDRDDIFIYELPKGAYSEDSPTMVLPVYRREVRANNGASNYQHYTHQLFGQPLLVPIPRHQCTYDALYNCVLNRMSRYVKRPEPSDEWWKIGEEAMQTSNDEEGSAESEDKPTEQVDNALPRRMFTFSMVNSYGSTDMATITDDGKPINFTTRSYVAMDWDTRAKNLFYDEKEADLMDADESVNKKMPVKKSVVQLTECIDVFTNQEQLGVNDTWYCPQCKEHQQAFKKFDLWKLPQYLVVHLKRFQYNRYWRDKLDTFVEYPTKGLCMKKWVINQDHEQNTVYDLIAVSNHYGGMGGGHYTAYGKNGDGNWYYFDDSSVSSSSEDEAVTKAGYVLVYRRRGSEDTYDHAIQNGACNGQNSDNEMDLN